MNDIVGYKKIDLSPYYKNRKGGLASVAPTSKDRLFAFQEWNRWPFVLMRNCYAFAADAYEPYYFTMMQAGHNVKTIYLPDPGVSNGAPPILTPHHEQILAGLFCDGFSFHNHHHPNVQALVRGEHLIAAYYGKKDYHFYRYYDGRWYHKQDVNEVTDRDQDGCIITDIQKANKGACAALVGFFTRPAGMPNLNIIIEDDTGKVLSGRRPFIKRPQTPVTKMRRALFNCRSSSND